MTTIKKLTATTVLLVSLCMTTFTLHADPPVMGWYFVSICVNGHPVSVPYDVAVRIVANNPNASWVECEVGK